MRVTLFLAAITLSSSAALTPLPAWSQAHSGGVSGGHAMAPAGHPGAPAGHTEGAGRAAGPARSPIASFPHTSAPRPSSNGVSGVRANYGARPMNQNVYSGGDWTSAGFIAHGSHSGQSEHGRAHDHHVGYGYGAVGYSFFPYGFGDGYGNSGLDYNYDSNDPSQQAAPVDNYADNAPPQVPYMGEGEASHPPYGPANYAQDTARMPYNPGAVRAQANSTASDGLGHPKVTLIFKDGRTPLKIQNYAMSQTRIFVRDNDADRDIALSELDIPATMATNDQAGVDFELPVKR